MAVFKTALDTQSAEFEQNRQDMLHKVELLRSYESRAVELSEKRRPRFEERGQLSPRQRLARLLDPGRPFLELFNMANFLVEDANVETSIPGSSIITGIGYVSGVRCMIVVDDSGINAGAATPLSPHKAVAAAEMAYRHKLPYVHLVESAGANLFTYTVELWAKGGEMFYWRARLSAAGIPTLTLLHGPSTAGGAYQPGMSDYVVAVKRNGLAALAGAALVQAATGELPDERELGGSEMHASVSGLVEYLAEDDAHGLQIMREVIQGLDWNRDMPSSRLEFDEPLYAIDELAGLIPADYKKAYDVRELIARLVDGSMFLEFKSRYGPATVCVNARIMGQRCALIGNNGPIDPNGATKAAQFMQLCDQSDTPVIFLSNTTGYMVGTEVEQSGMIKHGSKMIQAVANVRVPKITLYIGASFGAGNYGMCGHGYHPDFLMAWPNAETGVMGGEQAASTMDHVARVAAQRKGVELDEGRLSAQRESVIDHFDGQSNIFYTSGRLLDQGIIDPRDSRKFLGFALATCREARQRTLSPNAFGVARL
ncbi:MAG: carboxyl transferase domain-containing protein [Pseudomonadota bacterium]